MCQEAINITSSLFAQTGREIFAPRINNLLSSMGRKIKLASSWNKQFEDYWMEMSAKFYTVSSVVLGNTQRTLESVYVPMDLQLETPEECMFRADDFPTLLLEKYRKLLIKDSIGMGKTTMLKYMFLKVILKEKGFPIFVELRNLRHDHSIEAEIQSQLSRLNKVFDYRLMLDFFSTGEFVFFFDGFDEIEESERSVVVKDLWNFISKAYLNRFVMTSREENALAGFGSFIGAKILPLSTTSLINLLQKYGGSAGKTKSLVESILSGHYSEIEDFLHVPLLAGLLYRAYVETNMSELKLYQLCCNVFPVFYDQHDLSKDSSYIHKKRVDLSSDDFERILDYMALYSICYQNKCFSELEFCKMTKFAESHSSLSVNESDFCYDLTVCIPIFCKDATTYRWIHPSLCSYYFARYVYFESKEKAKEILLRLFNSKRISDYALTLRMYYDMDAVFLDKHVICSYLSSLLISYRKMHKDWIQFIGEMVASSDVCQKQMLILHYIHPELFEQVSETCQFAGLLIPERFCVSENHIQKIVERQEGVTLLDDAPDALISGL